jgi:hypothetical protein
VQLSATPAKVTKFTINNHFLRSGSMPESTTCL